MLDYVPGVRVVVGNGEQRRTMPVAELLPETYVWSDHQLPDT
jgi:cytidine deaminase